RTSERHRARIGGGGGVAGEDVVDDLIRRAGVRVALNAYALGAVGARAVVVGDQVVGDGEIARARADRHTGDIVLNDVVGDQRAGAGAVHEDAGGRGAKGLLNRESIDLDIVCGNDQRAGAG